VNALPNSCRDDNHITGFNQLRRPIANFNQAAACNDNVALGAAAKSVPLCGFTRFKPCPGYGKLWVLLGIRNLNDVAAFVKKVFG
jgi:hypothetical protein